MHQGKAMQQRLYFLQFMGGMTSLVWLEGMTGNGPIASVNALGCAKDRVDLQPQLP